MNIDIERLKTDAAYWDEMAPEGAQSYAPEESIYQEGWYKEESGSVFFKASHDEGWMGTITPKRTLIPRPQAPEAEWVDGLPPIKEVVEFKYTADGSWGSRVCTVLGYNKSDDQVWLHLDGNEGSNIYNLSKFEFRTIPNKAQRDRDELAATLWGSTGLGKDRAYEIADDVIAAGWKKDV